MEIIIDDKISLLSVQQEFNRVFPYLKINFFTISNRVTGIVQRKLIENTSRKFSEFKTDSAILKQLIITPQMTVCELENRIKNEFGLFAQVYRNSGRIWLETNETDGWTLEEQNNQGKALSA